MKCTILHEGKGRMRVHVEKVRMTLHRADVLEAYLNHNDAIVHAAVYERTGDVVITYTGRRSAAIAVLAGYKFDVAEYDALVTSADSRRLNREYQDKMFDLVAGRCLRKLFLPAPLAAAYTAFRSIRFLWKGVRCVLSRRLEVEVLDALSIGVSLLRGDFGTAGSVMFLLNLGSLLEEWTRKKSLDDLARSMALNVDKVWVRSQGTEVLVPLTKVRSGDEVVVRSGNMIPLDGTVLEGEAMVNQAALTGEAMPVRKAEGSTLYAGTVVEEGECVFIAKAEGGSNRYDKIVAMIEESEKLKSSLEGKAEHLADKLVPYTFLGTGLVWLFTRNVTKALSVLMVDFSCALKLSMPLAVLSAIREASTYEITVKGGKYLEAMADATTIVFDKTGTLTKAQPTVADVVSFNGQPAEELLRIAACLEEHFPHSMAKAVVREAARKELVHEELHTKVEYIVAHGISSTLEGKKIIIGSYHFVFEDEQAQIPEGRQELFDQLPEEYSRLYMAIDGKLAAVICIEDPLREEAPEVIRQLKSLGIHKVVMMTGDSDRIAGAIAGAVGVDEYYSEVLPEDKARFVEQEKQAGHKVIMIGDGINDSPALSAADVGIAISEGAQIAREIADVTIGADNLHEVATLKELSNSLMERIHKNYRMIVGINTGLIILGVAGIIPPTTSALLHNTSTLWISTKSMKNLLDREEA